MCGCTHSRHDRFAVGASRRQGQRAQPGRFSQLAWPHDNTTFATAERSRKISKCSRRHQERQYWRNQRKTIRAGLHKSEQQALNPLQLSPTKGYRFPAVASLIVEARSGALHSCPPKLWSTSQPMRLPARTTDVPYGSWACSISQMSVLEKERKACPPLIVVGHTLLSVLGAPVDQRCG